MHIEEPHRYNYLNVKTSRGGWWELPIVGKGPDQYNPELAYVAHKGYVEDLAAEGIGFEDKSHPDGLPQRAVPLVEGQARLVVGPAVQILR